VGRVRKLIESGKLPGAFKVPAAGRYAEAVRVPLAAVLQAEEKWALAPQLDGHPQRRRRGRRDGLPPTLRHFPELNDPPVPNVGCDGGVQNRPEDHTCR